MDLLALGGQLSDRQCKLAVKRVHVTKMSGKGKGYRYRRSIRRLLHNSYRPGSALQMKSKPNGRAGRIHVIFEVTITRPCVIVHSYHAVSAG